MTGKLIEINKRDKFENGESIKKKYLHKYICYKKCTCKINNFLQLKKIPQKSLSA